VPTKKPKPKTPVRLNDPLPVDARRRLERLAERRGVVGARAASDPAPAVVWRATRRALKAPGGKDGAVAAGVVRGRVGAGQASVSTRMAGELDTVFRDAQVDSLRTLQRNLARLEGTGATPLDDPELFDRILRARAAELHGVPRQYLAHWAVEAQAAVDRAVSEGLRLGESPAQVMRRVEEALDGEWWKIERIVRTETAFAFNAVQDDAVRALSPHYPDMRKRWTELVDDATGKPLDNRVAADSMVLHGQVTRPGTEFEMPRDQSVDPKTWGRRWAFPPNRPNDRAVITPWRPGWGIPAYELRGDRRVRLRR
jgi:hypothetical protein